MGDPFALTYKFYPNKNWAFAVDGGKAASGLYNRYYRNAFETYLPDSLTDTESIQYLSHKANSDWFLEAKFLYQWNAEKFRKAFNSMPAWAGNGAIRGLRTITCMKIPGHRRKATCENLHEIGLPTGR